MTFFLKEKTSLQPRGPDIAPPTNSQGVGAAFTTYFREVDTFNGISAATETEKMFAGKDAGERLGIDRLNQWYQENDAGYDHLRPAPTSVDDFIEMHGERGSDIILDMAREEAAKNPDAWADLDVSQEGVDARATEKLKEADQADAMLLGLSPNPVRNSLLGGLAAGVADPINLAATLATGGGGSILRVMLREAMVNGAVEAAQHPTRAKTAELLDKEAPGFVDSVAQGMVFGAAFGGLLDGIPKALRAVSYVREMNRLARDINLSSVTHEAAVQGAEKAIVRGEDPLKAVRAAILTEPPPARRPLILDDTMRVTPEPTALAPDPITSAPLEPAPAVNGEILPKKSNVANPRKPILSWMKKNGVDPNGWLGRELKGMGWSPKTHPGLFKKGGIKEADNIPPTELDQSIPGISWLAGKDDTGNYIDRNGLLRALDDESRGITQSGRKPYGRDYVPERAWADPDPEDRGFLITKENLAAREMAEPDTWRETLHSEIDAYLSESGFTLLPREIEEIKQIAATRGGDVEDLVYSAMSREQDEIEQASIRAMRNESYVAREVPWGDETGVAVGQDFPGGSPAGEPQAAAGNASQAGAGDQRLQVERTDAGDQYVVPGTRKVDDYQKHIAKAQAETKALQSAMRSGKTQERVEDDAGGLFGGTQRDMFSDPADPKSKPAQISMMEDLRGTLEAGGDFMVDVGNGKVAASALLKELDDDLDFEDILNACGKRGPA